MAVPARRRRLVRGDGLVGFNVNRSRTQATGLAELGLFTDVLITDQWRLRAGYRALWAINVAEASGNVDFDLARQGFNDHWTGSVFYHGPMIEFQFAF